MIARPSISALIGFMNGSQDECRLTHARCERASRARDTKHRFEERALGRTASVATLGATLTLKQELA
jgi:hypothetical protein